MESAFKDSLPIYRTFKQFMAETFEMDELRDMLAHGMDAGWSYLTYYHDTSALFEHFREELMGWFLGDQSETEFWYLRENAETIFDDDGTLSGEFMCAVVWANAEEYARKVTGFYD